MSKPDPHDRMRYLDRALVDRVLEVATLLFPDHEPGVYSRFLPFHRGHLGICIRDNEDGTRKISGYSMGHPDHHTLTVGCHKEFAPDVNLKMWAFLQERGIDIPKPPGKGSSWFSELVDFEDTLLSRDICIFTETSLEELRLQTDAEDWAGASMTLGNMAYEISLFERAWKDMETRHRIRESRMAGLWWPARSIAGINALADRLAYEQQLPAFLWRPGTGTRDQERALWDLVNNGGGKVFSADGMTMDREWLTAFELGGHHYAFKTPHLVAMAKMLDLETLRLEPVSYTSWVKSLRLHKGMTPSFSTAAAFYAHKYMRLSNSRLPWEKALADDYGRLHQQALASDPGVDPLEPSSPVGPGQQRSLFEENP